jgi:pimeloyl-ACP methyl ester carboxylesterase
LIIKIENKSVYASDAGQGIDNSKDTIVFLHGSGLSHIVWSLTEQFFSNKKFNVLSIDLPGHGNSEGPCLDSIKKIADWLERVFTELKLNNLILIGHSQGCLEALEYSFKYKSRLKKIVFIGGSYRMPVNKDLIDLASNGESDAVKLMMKWGYEGSKKFIGGNPVEKIIQSPRDISEILAIDLIACNNYENGSDAAKAISCPAMMIFGELDKMVNLEIGKKFSNLVKNSITHIIIGSGHMIMIEKAFEMREKILEFLNK